MICSGLYTALITPFNPDGSVDYEGFCFHIHRQLKAKVDGLVVLGTTGESSTLTQAEKETLIRLARKEAKELPLMVGCGAYSTEQTCENVRKAASLGADSVLVISPFYNKPTQEGLFRHFECVSQASPVPVMVYNHPGRTGVTIEIPTLERIAALEGICGMKDCTGKMSHISEVLSLVKEKRPSFSLFSGDDDLTFSILALGGNGVISGGANLVPERIGALVHAALQGDFEKAREIYFSLAPLLKALQLETHPIPLKAALQLAGLPSGTPRLPLTPLNPNYLPQLEKVLHGKKECALC